MKFVVLMACCVVCVVGRPRPHDDHEVDYVPILLDERTPIDELGGYGFKIQTGDGLTWAETASPSGDDNEIVRVGQYRFTHPDGTPHLLTYTAGKFGFRPVSDHLPTPHPLEPWHIEQIEFAKRQKE
ncbi:hypothetical protein OTU49_008935, partial [Cherax quadricarinatus]